MEEQMRQSEEISEEVQELVEKVKSGKKLKASDFLEEDDGRNPTQLHILAGLQGKNVYQGTVDKETVRRRRVKNKAARKARRANR